MRKRSQSSSISPDTSTSESRDTPKTDEEAKLNNNIQIKSARRSGFVWLTLFVMIAYSSWTVHHYQFENLPVPLTAEQAGKRGFSEEEAMKHVKALTELGPHPVGSDALDLAIQYVLAASEKIKKTAHWEVDVQVDYFHVNSGANRLHGGMFKGRTLVYSDLNHIVLRILPKYAPEVGENAILISSHIDTVFSTEGAGDCSSCVAVMLELARGTSQWAHGFKNAVIFLFNIGEEEGLDGAHSFITQHPWSSTIRMAVDLEAMGIGGKSSIFQAGPDPLAVENFASAAKYPSGLIIAQDLFSSGIIKSATDFQVYKEVAGLSGLDFAYTDNGAVYHTKNDKLELLKPGSLQHLGENMLAFLLQIAPSSQISKGKSMGDDGKSNHDTAIFFDVLGKYMVVYRQHFANMLHNSVIMQSLLIWTMSLLMGGSAAAISLVLSCLSIILMWIFSISFSALVAFILPLISSSPLPYVASPWLVIGLFAAPAFLGALTGQHLGHLILGRYLSNVYAKRNHLPPVIQPDLVKLETERWLFKAGSVQWLVLLILGTYYKIGSSYIALVWLVPPTFAYGLLEATLTPVRLPKPLKLATLLIGMAVPILVSAGIFIRFTNSIIGLGVRFDRNPGDTPEWLASVLLSIFIAVVICLTLVYLLSYVHLSGAKTSVVLSTCILFVLSLAVVFSGIIPPFTEDTARAVNVVHVVDTTGRFGERPNSFVSLSSITPGKLTKEIDQIKEGFSCGRDKVVDFVTFSVKYGCLTFDGTEEGWNESDIPTLDVVSDTHRDKRITQVAIDTKRSIRWFLAINTEEIEDFTFKVNSEEIVPADGKNSVDGWHIIQVSGGKNAPTKFDLTLFWVKNSTKQSGKTPGHEEGQRPLLKLRTDLDDITPKVETVLEKLPPWCSLFGKSTSPHTLSFLSSLPINF
ncbi:Peptidase M28 [Corchorus capsularis]|uniref:Vacuolar membrane protease n=1 Tax=Corchorus capsularis TaxID=210143 RepID=A0A1R3KHC1_COCAP|nr:Peptidase M28 [Corchorus capsularis]